MEKREPYEEKEIFSRVLLGAIPLALVISVLEEAFHLLGIG